MRIGIDLGGTKIEAVALADDGSEVGRVRVATPREDYPGTIEAIAEVAAAVDPCPKASLPVGIGIPGVISPATGLVKNANSTWLIGKPLDRDVQARLGRPVRIANDANCFAVSEATDGAGAGADIVFGVILGTGVGGGIVAHGRLLTGRNAVAGEWGHNPLPWPDGKESPGPMCYCGKRGCIETFLSGPALALDYFSDTDVRLSAAEIVARAEAGEAAAEVSLTRYEQRLARALAAIVNVLDPDIIVLGGGLSNIRRLYRKVPELLAPLVFSDRLDTILQPARHGDASGVRGAAWLWPPDKTSYGLTPSNRVQAKA